MFLKAFRNGNIISGVVVFERSGPILFAALGVTGYPNLPVLDLLIGRSIASGLYLSIENCGGSYTKCCLRVWCSNGSFAPRRKDPQRGKAVTEGSTTDAGRVF